MSLFLLLCLLLGITIAISVTHEYCLCKPCDVSGNPAPWGGEVEEKERNGTSIEDKWKRRMLCLIHVILSTRN